MYIFVKTVRLNEININKTFVLINSGEDLSLNVLKFEKMSENYFHEFSWTIFNLYWTPERDQTYLTITYLFNLLYTNYCSTKVMISITDEENQELVQTDLIQTVGSKQICYILNNNLKIS